MRHVDERVVPRPRQTLRRVVHEVGRRGAVVAVVVQHHARERAKVAAVFLELATRAQVGEGA